MASPPLKNVVGTGLALAGWVCCLTLIFLSMRAVMEVGGSCADGGPYVSAQPCPDGVAALLPLGIFGGLICVGFHVALAQRLGGRYGDLAGFAWPGLFLSLGWNFAEFGIDPPEGAEGPVWGWLVCAVLFALMGGAPLLGLARPTVLRKMLWPTAEESVPEPDPATRPRYTPRQAVSATVDAARPRRPGAVVERLERLAALRRSGDLTAAEYAAAKGAVLEDAP